MRTLFLLLALACAWVARGQLHLTTPAGDRYVTPELQLSFSLGEVAVETWSGAGIRITQGFHQPDFETTSVDAFQLMDVQVFPNPVRDLLQVTVLDSPPGLEVVQLTLVDLTGRACLTDRIRLGGNMTHTLNMGGLPPGMYVLTLEDAERHWVARYKITKI
jgi:hypothetical protein